MAVFSFRHDAALVPALLENITPLVHAWVSWDDRQASAPLISHEPQRRDRLLAAARALGADWILAADPDERFERGLQARIGALTGPGIQTIWSFATREMYGPDMYRVDGLWGGKSQARLFPCAIAGRASAADLHGQWYADSAGLITRKSGFDLYHLRMATPARRQLRRDTYAAADPARRFQSIGYDYLADDRGRVLVAVPQERGFVPPHIEDGGLWAPAVRADVKAGGQTGGQTGVAAGETPLAPDPVRSRLLFVQASLRHRGLAAAVHVMQDLVAADPQDADLIAATAQMCLQAGDHSGVAACAAALAMHPLAQAYGLSVLAQSVLAQAEVAQAEVAQAGLVQADHAAAQQAIAAAQRAIAAAQQVCPGNRSLARVAQSLVPDEKALAAPQANWRRWVTGPAQVYSAQVYSAPVCGGQVCGDPSDRGASGAARHNAQAALAVVVIGYRAPADLRGAVQSLLDQDVRAEIVVVNSGGGDARVRLAGLLDRIVLIEVRSRLFIGAARNIGIDATAAPYVAFLASDCRAGPGWVQARLARHLDGAAMVSSPVLPDQPGNWCSLAANALLHWRRRPGLPATAAVHYGRSYSRAVFRSCGYFAPGLRSMEDTEFNAVADAGFTPVWAPEVLTLHCYPTGLWGFLRDCVGRSIRRVANPPLSDFVAPPAVWRQALSYTRHRHKVALAGFGLRRDIPPARRLGVRALLGLALGLNLAGLVIGYRRLARQGAAEIYIQEIPQPPAAPDAPHPQSRARVLIAHQNWRRSFAQVKPLFASQNPGDDARLRDHLTAIVDIAPAETAPVMLLCDVLVRLGCLEQALRAAENALLTRPGNPHFWTKASLLAGQAGQPEQAIFYGQGALARAPANTTAHLALELAYRALQKPYLARRRSVLRKALDGKAG